MNPNDRGGREMKGLGPSCIGCMSGSLSSSFNSSSFPFKYTVLQIQCDKHNNIIVGIKYIVL